MKVYIKNMICIRCKMFVEHILQKLDIPFHNVLIGEVNLNQPLSSEQFQAFHAAILPLGLEIIEDRKQILAEKIKTIIVELIHSSNQTLTTRFSTYLSKKLNYDYTYLANTFSEIENRTIESYIISEKIERVKTLLACNQMTLTEIAYQLNYSSVAHLSFQFKKVTGLTPSQFKNKKVINNNLMVA